MKRSWRKTSAVKAVECAGSSWINISLHLWLQVASLWQSDMSFQTPSVKPKEKWSYVLHINTQKCQRIHSPAWKQKCRGKTLGIKPWKCKGLLWRSGFIQHHTWGRYTSWRLPLLLVPFFLLVGVTDSISQWAPCPSLCYTSTHFWNRALPGWRLQSHPFVSHWSHQKHHFRISENKYFSKKILLCMRMKLLRCSWM